MVEPTDVPCADELVEQLRASEQRQAELRLTLYETTRRLDRLTRRVDQLSCETRTRRLIIVDEDGNERIVATTDADHAVVDIRGTQPEHAGVKVTAAGEMAGIELRLADVRHGAIELTEPGRAVSPAARLEIGGLGGPMATVLPHVVRIDQPDGASVHLLTTPDDAELYLHSGPARVSEPPESARATIHVMRGLTTNDDNQVGQASLELASGDQPARRFETE